MVRTTNRLRAAPHAAAPLSRRAIVRHEVASGRCPPSTQKHPYRRVNLGACMKSGPDNVPKRAGQRRMG